MLRIFNYFFVIFLFIFNVAFAEKINVFEFTENELSELKVRKVRGADKKTVYTLGNNENGIFIRANANNSASGLGKEIKINLNKTPFLNITWKVEKDPTTNPLMGWESSSDTLTELKMEFTTKELAINYAKKMKIEYEVIEPKKRKIIKKSYADNFLG